MGFKEQLSDRLSKLQARRAELVAPQAADLARVDEQIAACDRLVKNWGTFTVDEALAALQTTGVRLQLVS